MAFDTFLAAVLPYAWYYINFDASSSRVQKSKLSTSPADVVVLFLAVVAPSFVRHHIYLMEHVVQF